MKLHLERDLLADAVAWAARTLPNRPTAPVLSGMLLQAEGERLHMTASDQEVYSQVEIDATVGEPGAAVVSGRLLADIAKALPPHPVAVTLEGTRLVLACGRASFTLPTLPVEDYPALLEMPAPAGTVAGDVLADAVAQVSVAASRDDTLPVLTGVHTELGPETITLAATDKYRLAVRSLPWNSTSGKEVAPLLVRGRTLSDLSRPLAGVPEVVIGLDEAATVVGVSGGGRRSTTPLLEGAFPDFRRLLDTGSTTVVTMSTAELVDSVKRVKLVLDRQPNTPIKITFSSDGEALLRASGAEDARATETAECELEGEAITIAFNPEYLLDGLGAVGTERVTVTMTQPNRPAVFRCEGSDIDYQYLLMPVRLP